MFYSVVYLLYAFLKRTKINPCIKRAPCWIMCCFMFETWWKYFMKIHMNHVCILSAWRLFWDFKRWGIYFWTQFNHCIWHKFSVHHLITWCPVRRHMLKRKSIFIIKLREYSIMLNFLLFQCKSLVSSLLAEARLKLTVPNFVAVV